MSGMSASMPCVQVCSPSRHGHVQGNVGAACGKVDSSRAVRGGHLGRASGQDPPLHIHRSQDTPLASSSSPSAVLGDLITLGSGRGSREGLP